MNKARGFTDRHVPDLAGRIALVTGANTGLGFEAARVLARQGAQVVIGCRSPEKAAAALDRIRQQHPDAQISSVSLDLGDLASVREAASELDELPHLDLLINNAGIMMPPLELTADGYESQFGVNHLGPFALTGLLLPKLENADAARVVNTSSIAARSGRMMFDDINAENGYSATARYSMSKLANLLFSSELERRLRDNGSSTVSVACHPGIANTELSRYLPGWFSLMEPVVKHLFNTPLQGAWPTLQAATDASVRGGEYYGPSRRRQTSGPSVKVSAKRVNEALAGQLWQVSESMTGVSYL